MTNYYIAAQFTEDDYRIELKELALVTDDGRELYLSSTVKLNMGHGRQELIELTRFCDIARYGAPRFVSYADTFGWCCISYYFGLIGINLPSGFVNHYYDLKQESERLGVDLPTVLPAEHSDCLTSARWARDAYSYLKDYEQRTII